MTEQTATDWQSMGDWHHGRVRSGSKTAIWLSLLFGIAFTGISLPAVFAISDELNNENYAILLVLLFPLVGVGALLYCVYSVLAWRKFGVTEICLDPVPGSIGGDLGGALDIKIPYTPALTINITLNCNHITVSGSGKNRSTHTKAIWQRQGVAQCSPTSGGTHCEFRFAIPEDLPQSEVKSSNYHQWLLQLECDLPGIDFNRNFVVPVFYTDTVLFSKLTAPYAKDSAPLTEAPAGIVRISHTADGCQFYYPWYRHLWMGMLSIIFGAIFAGIGFFIGTQDASIVFPIVFGGVGVVILCVGLYVIGNTLTTTVSSQGIKTIRNIFGIRFQRKIKLESITNLEKIIKSQMQNGSSNKVYYAIIAHTRDDRKVVIADTLEGSRLAGFIELKIHEALGWNTNKTDEEIDLVI